MKIRRGHVGALLCAAALGVAAGCGGGGSASGGGETAAGGDATEAPDTGSGGGGGTAADGGLSIDEVKTLILEGDLNVRGWVVDVGGTTYLCSSAQGSPPACGKPSLVLVGYGGDVPSTAEVVVTGQVAGNKLTVG
jgi:hypothetical protein